MIFLFIEFLEELIRCLSRFLAFCLPCLPQQHGAKIPGPFHTQSLLDMWNEFVLMAY